MSGPQIEMASSSVVSRRQMMLGAALTLGGLIVNPLEAFASPGDEITHTSAVIHQRRTFNASPKRVYDALTDETQFHKVTMLSGAMSGGMPPGAAPTKISTVAGGSFTLFGGVISGRHIELVPNTRIVQAWRPGDWKPGVFSLVKFELAADHAGTVLTFEHSSFPDAAAAHLAEGWDANYWTPLTKYLA
jgi:uncharacterized protein YndB with AHSA1/START domain